MKKLTLGLSAAALMIGGAAYADSHGNRPNPDTNGDGVVTRAESQAFAANMFAKMDANQDGKLDRSDREAHRQEMKTRMFDAIDTNKDGTITRAEFMAFDGPRRGGDGHHRMGHRRGGHHGGWMMKMADTNNDGAISQAEFIAAADKRFNTMDANKDGKVTAEERDAYRDQMRAKWHDRDDS